MILLVKLLLVNYPVNKMTVGKIIVGVTIFSEMNVSESFELNHTSSVQFEI